MASIHPENGDCEKGIPLGAVQGRNGWVSKIAQRMGVMSNMTIVRTFADMQIEYLLYRQAYLQYLEDVLRRYEQRNSQSTLGGETKQPINGLPFQRHSDDLATEEDVDDFELIKTIPARLMEYNETVCKVSTILRMNEPSEYDLNYLQKFLVSEEMVGIPQGVELRIYGSAHPDNPTPPGGTDLVTLVDRMEADAFSTWFMRIAPHWLLKYGGKYFANTRKIPGMNILTDKALLRVTKILCAILAALLPILEMACLSLVDSFAHKLVIAGCVAITYSLLFCLFSDSTHASIFIFSATLSAVSVVFISSQKGET